MSDPVRPTDDFLGTGWSFPPTFRPSAGLGGVAMTAGEDDIRASLAILFGTALGERFLQPTYGLDMHELMFEAISTTMKTYLEDRIRTCILIYEPRINLLRLEVNTARDTEGRLEILVEYAVRTTNSRYNLVFPFAVSDGNELRPLPALNA